MSRAGYLFILHIILAMFSVGGIFSKLAASEQMLSHKWILYYGAVLFILFVYAIAWQQIIKRVDLSVAYVNRSIAILWSMIWAVVIFGEAITLQNIIGVILVVAGTIIVNGEAYE